MSILTTIFQQPTTKLFPSFSSTFDSLQILSFARPSFRNSGFVSRRLVVEGSRGLRLVRMTKMVRASGFSGGGSSSGAGSNGDECVGVIEQEGLVHGSSDLVANGLHSTVNRMSKWLVAGLFGIIILWRHDAEALWAAMGSILNAGLSVTLKKIFNQERPFSTLRTDPGMPSSHAQAIFYSIIFAIFSVLQWLGVNELSIILCGLILSFGCYLTWLRVLQRLHSSSQVLVGAAVGSLFSILWFWSWDALVLKAFLSFFWVRLLVIFGGFAFCLGFLLHVIQHWFKVER